jgi:hypothetical protein
MKSIGEIEDESNRNYSDNTDEHYVHGCGAPQVIFGCLLG